MLKVHLNRGKTLGQYTIFIDLLLFICFVVINVTSYDCPRKSLYYIILQLKPIGKRYID